MAAGLLKLRDVLAGWDRMVQQHPEDLVGVLPAEQDTG